VQKGNVYHVCDDFFLGRWFLAVPQNRITKTSYSCVLVVHDDEVRKNRHAPAGEKI